MSWKHQVSNLCLPISRNIGIFSKIRHNVSLHLPKQLYYNLIYPYISFAIIYWGSTYATQIIKNIQTKQNHIVRLIFFAILYGPDTDSALPFLNLLDLLTVNNIYKLQLLSFTHNWHSKTLSNIFSHHFKFSMKHLESLLCEGLGEGGY